MDPSSLLTSAMNNISLEEAEEIVLAIEEEHGDISLLSPGFDAKLCVVARFLTEGRVDFPAMQQTLAALWKPGKGVYIKELESNLFLFQFYHEIDVKRVMEGCPWSFNRRALIMSRLKEGENPISVELNTLELWVQIHDLKVGFMSNKIVKQVAAYIGKYVESCPSNNTGVWREYMRVRVAIDLSKPLKRRMKLRQSGADWYWISFKYENVPMFCFICGVLRHSEKYCSQLFVVPENEIIKPYGPWMRAPFKKQVKPIGAKWLRSGNDEGDSNPMFSNNVEQHEERHSSDPHFTPTDMGAGFV